MTVDELIEKLKALPGDMKIQVLDSDRVVSLISKPTETGGATLCSAGSTGASSRGWRAAPPRARAGARARECRRA